MRASNPRLGTTKGIRKSATTSTGGDHTDLASREQTSNAHNGDEGPHNGCDGAAVAKVAP